MCTTQLTSQPKNLILTVTKVSGDWYIIYIFPDDSANLVGMFCFTHVMINTDFVVTKVLLKNT